MKQKSIFGKIVILLVISLLSILILPSVSAAGGGGGGGGGSSRCNEDIWTCTDWAECSPEFLQTRKCVLTFDCPAVETPKPETVGSCQYVSKLLGNLKCQSLDTVKERVRCRLELPEQAEKELQLNYLPEECKSFPNIGKREACVRRYINFQKCFTKDKNDKQKVTCGKSVINLGDIKSELASCNAKADNEKTKCLEDVVSKVDSIVKFRIYNLEEKAEELLSQGKASKDVIISLVADFEEKKQAYNNAKTLGEKKQIILDVQKQWHGFIKTIKAK